MDRNIGDRASQVCIFLGTSTLYLGSQEERKLYLPNPGLTGLGGMLPVALLSPKAASSPSYIGSKPGLRRGMIVMLMHRAGLKPQLAKGIFLCGFGSASKAELRFALGGCSGHSLPLVAGVSH